jgi:site-specific DNA-methyltransferase (adenine-specific)
MLDLLPNDLWSNSKAKFLDPVSKSGVFLREIAKRLMVGLEQEIPDKYQRANHIFTTQLYGIAITELTSLLSRRTVYCSKTANGKYSVCEEFKDNQGNIIFNRIKHTWDRNHCMYCGASKEVYDRGDDLETYAYPFIHTYEPEKLFNNMTFDVIIGNPPYQLDDGGNGASARPLYHLFVEQAKRLNPRYLVMIIPARWYSGGKGLDDFRNTMLNDKRIRTLVDYPNSQDCFPSSLKIEGGVCYFLIDKLYKGNCLIKTMDNNKCVSIYERPLLEKGSDVFIRYNESIKIYRKIKTFKESTMNTIISTRKPFGFDTKFRDFKDSYFKGAIKIYANKTIGYIAENKILQNKNWVKPYKVFISKSYGMGNGFPSQIINKPFVGETNSCSTETYLLIGPCKNKKEAENMVSYIKTKFFRFLVLLRKITQDGTQIVYSFVPMQDFNEEWTDEKLYKKYKLDEKEIAFIESMIKPME